MLYMLTETNGEENKSYLISQKFFNNYASGFRPSRIHHRVS